MAIDYGKMTDEEFDRILGELVEEMGTVGVLSHGEVWNYFAETLNNEILDRWAHEEGLVDDDGNEIEEEEEDEEDDDGEGLQS